MKKNTQKKETKIYIIASGFFLKFFYFLNYKRRKKKKKKKKKKEDIYWAQKLYHASSLKEIISPFVPFLTPPNPMATNANVTHFHHFSSKNCLK
jgi:hypothetical protein